MMLEQSTKILVLGASGLVGEAIAADLNERGMKIAAVARSFTKSQRNLFGASAIECPIVDFDQKALSDFITNTKADIVINCIGVLQDAPNISSHDIHAGFIGRLLAALEHSQLRTLIIQLSVPGDSSSDVTAFSLTKRRAEKLIHEGAIPYVVIRPAFVIAPSAYGGSALVRTLAALPIGLPKAENQSPFQITAMNDILETIAFVAKAWATQRGHFQETWEVMSPQQTTIADVVQAFRDRLGCDPPAFNLPSWLLTVGAACGDAASHLGWRPPIRTTALVEMRRGVRGDPSSWMNATGIRPAALVEALASTNANVQETWFARLYGLKALVILSLVLFWSISGIIALASFTAASGILVAQGFNPLVADVATILSSLGDICIGLAIAYKPTSRLGVIAGIAMSLLYMIGAALLTPDLWFEPLGALVKTGPAIVLMLVALAIQNDR